MKYYYIENGAQVGPFEVSELYNKGIRPETLVWCDTMENWTPAWQVSELKPVIDSSIVKRQPPKYEPDGPQATATAQQSATSATRQEARRKGCGTRSLIALLILVIVGSVLVFTCPDKKAHEDAIRQEFNTAMSQKMGTSNGIIESVIQLGSKYIMGMAAESALDKLLTVDNYFVCSVGTIDYEGKSRVASIGLLNHVFTVNKDDIVKALDQAEEAAQQLQDDENGDGDIVESIIDIMKKLF